MQRENVCVDSKTETKTTYTFTHAVVLDDDLLAIARWYEDLMSDVPVMIKLDSSEQDLNIAVRLDQVRTSWIPNRTSCLLVNAIHDHGGHTTIIR